MAFTSNFDLFNYILVPLGPHCATDSACEQRCTDTTRGMMCSCRRGYRLAKDKRSCVGKTLLRCNS